MKIQINSLACLVLVLFFCMGCGSNVEKSAVVKKVNGHNVMVTSFEKVKSNKKAIYLSELIEFCEPVYLENSDEALTKPWWSMATEHHICIRQEGGPVQLFDRKGRFLTNVGAVGQGPGEYVITAMHEAIDEQNERIYISPMSGDKIMVYNFSGNYLNDITLPHKFHKPRLHLSEDGTLTVMHMPFDTNEKFAVQLDREGEVIKEHATPEYALSQAYYDNEIFSYQNSPALDFFYTVIDTLYYLDLQACAPVPVYTMEVPEQLSKYPWIRLHRELGNYFLTSLFNVSDGKSYCVATDKKTRTSFLVDKIVNDFYGGIEVPLLAFNKGYLVHNVEPGKLTELIEERLSEGSCTQADKQKLNTLLDTFDDDSNNIVFIGKLKPF